MSPFFIAAMSRAEREMPGRKDSKIDLISHAVFPEKGIKGECRRRGGGDPCVLCNRKGGTFKFLLGVLQSKI